jgi:hypothetical protein
MAAVHARITTSRRSETRPVVALGWWCAALVGAAAAMHLYLYFDYFHRVATIGPLFLVNAAAGFVITLLLLARPQPIVTVAGILYPVGTLAGFLLAVEVGLFGFHESLRGGWQETAGLVEAAATLSLIVLLIAQTRRRA